MKFFSFVVLLVLLASCGTRQNHNEADIIGPNDDIIIPADDEFLDDMMDEIDKIDETWFENEILEIDAAYRNPGWSVDMVLTIGLNNGIIQSINATATTYDISDFNEAAQALIGKAIEEGEDFYVAGSSLTSEAFNNAIKSL